MKPNRSTWAAIAEAPMSWDTSDVEPAATQKRDPKRPPPTPVRTKRPTNEAGGYGEEAWNVTNSISGQVFSHVPGKTPIDAKRYVMRSNPRLQGMHMADLSVSPMQPVTDEPPPAQGSGPKGFRDDDRGSRWSRNEPIDTGQYLTPEVEPVAGSNDTRNYRASRRPPPAGNATGDFRAGRPRHAPQAVGTPPNDAEKGAPIARGRTPEDGTDVAEPPTYIDRDPRRYPNANEDEVTERVFRNMLEIVRKKKGGGGFVLYGPNKGKKNKPKKLGEFPTRAAAKAAELARNPPRDAKELQRARKRVDKLRKDPKARARAEKGDLSGRKRIKKSGAPAHDRRKSKREELTRSLEKGIRERLFHEDELPGSPWDERISDMHPDHIAADKKLASHHKNMERASIGSLGAAQKALSRILRGMAKVQPGDVSKDADHGKTFMPVMLDVDGTEVGPLHLYIDGGHVKIELSGDARQQISGLDPDCARRLRGSLSTYEADHLPGISDARKAWMGRDRHMDDMHVKLQKHIAGMSDVERHLAKQLLKGKREN